MLGQILDGLTNPKAAEASLAAIADAALLHRVKSAANANAVTPGVYVAATIRHLLDHGSEEIWLDLIGKMANSPQPGAAALQAILGRAFPMADTQSACSHGHEEHNAHHSPAQTSSAEGHTAL